MKKLLAILLAVMLSLSVLALFASAENDPDGFEFDIYQIDATVTGEKGLILTSASALAASSAKWSVMIHCQKVSNNIYKVKTDVTSPSGELPIITFAEGDIVIAIHSATSNPDMASEWANVYQKLAALNVKAGMYFELVGIDLTAKTATNGKAICTIAMPDGSTVSETSDVSEESEEPEISDDSVESSAAESSVAADESSTVQDESSVAASNESSMSTEKEGIDTTTVVLIVLAAVAIIAVVVFIARKKK